MQGASGQQTVYTFRQFISLLLLLVYLRGMRIVSSVSGGASRTNSTCLPDLFLAKISLVSCGVLIVSTWEDLRCTWPMIERKIQIYYKQ